MCQTANAAAPDTLVTGRNTAKGDVKDDAHRVVDFLDIAIVLVDSEVGEAPAGRHRLVVLDVVGLAPLRPAPDLDEVVGPLDRVHATVGIAPLTERLRHAAPLAGGLARRFNPAVAGLCDAAVVSLVDSAGSSLGRLAHVGRDSVVRLQVPVLVDVELAIRGPVRARHPESRPGTACRLRKVAEVGDEQTPLVCVLALDSHTPSELIRRLRVNANVDIIRVGLDELEPLSLGLGGVVDMPFSRITIERVRGESTLSSSQYIYIYMLCLLNSISC